MASLVPCTVCRRHVRRQETQCRFCGAELPVSQGMPVEVAIPRGVKRATLFALGLTLAGQACADESTIPVYGAPSPPGAGAANGTGGTDNPMPLYGSPVAPAAGGNGGSPGKPDASPPGDVIDGGSDAAAADAAAEDAAAEDAGG